MKLRTIIKRSISLLITMLISIPLFSITVSSKELFDFANFTEEDAVSFVEQCEIDIPEEFAQLEDFSYFTKGLILQSYNNPNVAFCFNYNVTQEYAEQIRSAVRSYMNLDDIPTVVSTTTYNLQYNTVMDENGNWVTSGGYYNPKWVKYNCYAFSINRAEQPQFYSSGTKRQYQPGNMCNEGGFTSTSTIEELALLVEKDLMAMGFSNISLSSTIPTITSTQELICVRRYNKYDYHFMRYDLETDAWYHKPSNTAVLKYNYIPSNDNLWYTEYSDTNGEHPSTYAYDSDIVFITYSKNQLNVSTDGEVRGYIQPNKDLFCELIFQNSGTYEIEFTSTYSLKYEIYDEDFEIVKQGSGTAIDMYIDIEIGKYYLRINFESNTNLHFFDVIIQSHSFNHHYEAISSVFHKAYCACGAFEFEEHVMVDGECELCGEVHVHEYTEYEYYSNTQHIAKCPCGEIGTDLSPHTVGGGIGRFKTCILCGGLVDTMSGPNQLESVINMVTANGSYILPNGVIVLVDQDIEAYLNGTLVFYNRGDSSEAA